MFRQIVLFLLLFIVFGATISSCEESRHESTTPFATVDDDSLFAMTPTVIRTDSQATTLYPELMRRIEEAKRLLAPVRMHTARIGGNDAVIAVWNPTLGGAPTRVVIANGLSKTPGFNVTVRHCNGVNSHYHVNAPDGYITLAMKTNVRGATPPYGPTAVVYVPYSDNLHTREIMHAGIEYLHAMVGRAGDRLDERNVRSMIDPDRKVTETVPVKILVTLLIIEHIDPDVFDAKGVEHVVGKVLVTLGTNRTDAFRYAVSGARARGLAQFIPSTYAITRLRYPRAALPISFVTGMTDHEFAVMAQYCLADWSQTKLPVSVLRRLNASERQEKLGMFLAAAYNGGEDRAARAYLADPAHWDEAGHGLAPETVKYIVIFRAVFRQLYP